VELSAHLKEIRLLIQQEKCLNSKVHFVSFHQKWLTVYQCNNGREPIRSFHNISFYTCRSDVNAVQLFCFLILNVLDILRT